MMHRYTRIAACAALLSLALTGATLQAGSPFYKLDVLTFSGPVALPGVTLGAGTYNFEVADRDSGDVVRVRNQQNNQVAFMGFTYHVERPDAGREGNNVILGEARPGQAPPILAWFPVGERRGYEFIYRDRTR